MIAAVISKSDCPYCVKVKRLLDDFGYEVREFNKSEQRMISNLFDATGFKTSPQVFIDGKHIGDYEETYALLTGQTLV
jgi:glutaredoxin